MKCILYTKNDKATNGKQKTTSALIPNKERLKGAIELLTIDSGVVATSKITNGLLDKTVILHTDDQHGHAIDVERRLIERTTLTDEYISYVNLDELIDNFLPPTQLFTKRLVGDEIRFTFNVKTYAGKTHLSFSAVLNFETLSIENIKKRLTDYTHNISKLTHFIENYNNQTHKMGEYLDLLRNLILTSFSHFSSSQFQSFMSVAKHADVLQFERCRDSIEYDSDDKIESLKDDIETIKTKIKDRVTFNLKGVKIYFVGGKTSVNLLGVLISDPSPDKMNMILSHIMMCGQLNDFKTKIERTKLLHA